MRDTVFISYSRKDKDWLERLRVYLEGYEHDGLSVWVWDVEHGPLLAYFAGDAAFTAVAAHPRSARLFSGDHVGQVHLLRLEEG